MGITRVLMLGALIWLSWFIYQRLKQKKIIEKIKLPRKLSSRIIKKCHLCGLHVPLFESIEANGHYYCCKAHMEKDLDL